jgi:hypothetical protein
MVAGRAPTRYIVSFRQLDQMYRELTATLLGRMIACERPASMDDAVVHRQNDGGGDEEITPW